jgi:glutamate synthase (NADPH/NADH) large chain/glutamate synthase (ferredoxin)
VRTLDELIGRTDLLVADEAIEHWKARGIDLTHVLTMPDLPPDAPRRRVKAQEPVLDDALDWTLIDAATPVMAGEQERVELDVPVFNVNRCVGGLLSAEITRRRGAGGLPDDSVGVTFRGSAGQSFGGWLAPGVAFHLYGDVNDYCGKGLSGGVIAVQPPEAATFAAEENVLIGNTSLYGATSGRAFFRGLAGERFGVRNSGALAVVEGVGDHGCEYMTGGRVVVLGRTGRNFAAGMSGGIAYVLDEDGSFAERCNMGMVGFDEISEWDATELRGLVEEHAQRTGSTVARRVLDMWADTLPKFVKVMPHDYKRVLAEMAAERDAVIERDQHETSTSGEGFVITETEELEAR